MDLTNATLPELKARKKEVEELISGGQMTTQLIDERNMLSNRIAELSGNEVDEEEEESDPVVVRLLEEIELFGVPIGAYFADTTAHINVRSVIIPAFRQLKQELADTTASSVREVKELKEEAFELNDTISQLHNEIAKLKAEKFEAEQLAEDRMTRINNAYSELLEAKQTIDELNDKLTAAKAPKTPVRTNSDGYTAETIEKKLIYGVERTSLYKFSATYADTDETFEDYVAYKDIRYKEVTKADAETFRAAYLEQHPAPVVEEEVQVEPTAPPIREEDSTGSELVTEAPTVAGEVSREEFEALKARVAYLERPTGASWN